MKTNSEKLIQECPMVVGETYPLYGMITEIVSQEPGKMIAKINNNINAVFQLNDTAMIEKLKERAFEPGIFVAKVVTNYPLYMVSVDTVIFGPTAKATN